MIDEMLWNQTYPAASDPCNIANMPVLMENILVSFPWLSIVFHLL
jgi:hypothetical protein